MKMKAHTHTSYSSYEFKGHIFVSYGNFTKFGSIILSGNQMPIKANYSSYCEWFIGAQYYKRTSKSFHLFITSCPPSKTSNNTSKMVCDTVFWWQNSSVLW